MACYSSWEIVEHKADTLKLRMTLGAPWPWQGEVLQTLTIEDDALILRLEIHTLSGTFPASAGWHPWFAKRLDQQNEQEQLQVLFDADWQEEAGNNELPESPRV